MLNFGGLTVSMKAPICRLGYNSAASEMVSLKHISSGVQLVRSSFPNIGVSPVIVMESSFALKNDQKDIIHLFVEVRTHRWAWMSNEFGVKSFKMTSKLRRWILPGKRSFFGIASDWRFGAATDLEVWMKPSPSMPTEKKSSPAMESMKSKSMKSFAKLLASRSLMSLDKLASPWGRGSTLGVGRCSGWYCGRWGSRRDTGCWNDGREIGGGAGKCLTLPGDGGGGGDGFSLVLSDEWPQIS